MSNSIHKSLLNSVSAMTLRGLSVFGSILRGDFNEASDVDLLVEFKPGKRIGLLGMSALELELSRLIGRKADLRTPNDISRHFRQRVMAEAQVQYAS